MSDAPFMAALVYNDGLCGGTIICKVSFSKMEHNEKYFPFKLQNSF